MLWIPTSAPQRGREKAAASREEQLTQLYETYKKPMWRYAFQILHDEHLADDVVQSVFQKIIEKFEFISSLNCNKLHAYIVIMVRNMAYSACRQRKHQSGLDIEKLLESVPDTGETPEEAMIRLCDYQTVMEVKDSLHTAYKDILTMKFVYQYSDQEIAQIMGIRPDSVRVVTHRAIKSLRKACRNRM